ncbi:MAG TPA: M56 family metallopeptidase, partial [Gemmatimonadaceae bacterium]|nr:M56 family metallopeptidase [Gemmatimonadaceae bacterium]
ERLAVPVTWGIVYPAVLLPQDADTWSEERRRFVLVHEMAHVKRFDALTQLVAQISIALFWFDPLVWIAAHRMRVEREHACDDYVLRDGTTPSLYAGELLEMVRSIGTPHHDRAAPAFAALAMARRSEFEGRMLSILDPRIDRKNLNRRGTLMTAVIVALLTFPLAALRPFQQPAAARDEFPESFKITFSEAPAVSQQSIDGGILGGDTALRVATQGALTTGAAAAAIPAAASTVAQTKSSSTEMWPSVISAQSPWSCETSYWASRKGEQISVHTDSHTQLVQYVSSVSGRCAEAAVIGPIKFSADERHITQLAPGGFARFRERDGSSDRSVSVAPVGDGSLSYSAVVDGKSVPFLGAIQTWFENFLPEVLRETGINVPERVARIRSESGVAGVLREIRQIRSTSARRTHYEALLKGAPLTDAEGQMVLNQAVVDLKDSSSDLSAILQQMPRGLMKMKSSLDAMGTALSSIQSSGDKANTLQIMAPSADNETLVVLARAAESLQSSGDKANFLMSTAAQYLGSRNDAVRNSFFRAANTISSSGDLSNVLITAVPYGHAAPSVTLQIIEASNKLSSSGDAANVLLSMTSQRLLQPSNSAATLAVITRTLTMGSSGDRANVLMSLPSLGLLSTKEVRDAFVKAALALPSEEDRGNVLASAARQ